MDFKYFYGNEAEAYTFYRIPKLLITDPAFKNLTSDAKILYGLMLDRMSLSAKNGWFDEEGRVYIYYSIEDVMESMNCSKNKGMKSLQELDSATGIGLIERKKQGQGKPTIIYVKNFVLEKSVSESQNLGFKTPTICDSRFPQFENPESQDMSPNKNKYNINLPSETESNLILSMEKRTDEIDVNAYAELIRNNLELDFMLERYRLDKELIEGIYELVVETVVSQADSIVISSTRYPMSLVRSKFLKLNSSHIEYVMDCLSANTTRVRNIKKYMLAMQDFLEENTAIGSLLSVDGKLVKVNDLKGEPEERYYLSEKLKAYCLSPGTKNFMHEDAKIDLPIARALLSTMGNSHRSSVNNYVTTNGRVRALTMREVHRLMGFPDDYKIEVSKAQAYKQAGNSIVVDVLIHLVREIINAEEWN